MLKGLCGGLVCTVWLWAAAASASAFSAESFLEKLEQDSVLSELESALALAKGNPGLKKSLPSLQQRIKEEKRRVEKVVRSLRPLALKAQQKQDVNVCDGQGRTLLMGAVCACNGEAIDYLLGECPALDVVDEGGRTALDYDANEGGGLLAVRLASALDSAIQAGDFGKVRHYCKAGISPNTMLPGGPLVGKLLQAGQCQLAVELCRGKKMENEAMNDGTLVSELIVGSGNSDMIRVGAEAFGKSLWVSSPGGADSLLQILRSGNLVAVQYYTHHFGFGDNLCTLAVRHSTPSVVTWVLQQSGAVGNMDSWGCFPIFEAARRGDMPVFEAVLAAGADVAVTNDRGETLLMHAALGGNVFMLNVVLEKLPQELVPATDSAGRTAADYARMSGVLMVESLLSTHGLRPQSP